ncbi:hypothetical protein [Streptomyces hokutonensis]|uniref:hypothetical protein n=1 Tax=Streptomyces hokutonensis TaxID=1306990 RepID=UPI00340A2DB3
MAAVERLREIFPDREIILVADSHFVTATHRDERAAAEVACDSGKIILSGVDKQADNWILKIADRHKGIVVTNDKLRGFAPAYPWLLQRHRVWSPSYIHRYREWDFEPCDLRLNRTSKGQLDPSELKRAAQLKATAMQLVVRWRSDAHQQSHGLRISATPGAFVVMEHDLMTGYGVKESSVECTWTRNPIHTLNTQYGIAPSKDDFYCIEESDDRIDLVSRRISSGNTRWSKLLLRQGADKTSALRPCTIKVSPDGVIGFQFDDVDIVWSISNRTGNTLGKFSIGVGSTWEVTNELLIMSRNGHLRAGAEPTAWSSRTIMDQREYRIAEALRQRVLIKNGSPGSMYPRWWVLDFENEPYEIVVSDASRVFLGSEAFYVFTQENILSCRTGPESTDDLWAVEEEGALVMGEAGNTVLIADRYNQLLAIDNRDGRRLWSYGDSLSLPEFQLSDDVIVCYDEENIELRAPQDGSLLADLDLNQPIDQVQILDANWFIAELRDGSLTGLQLIPL